MVDNTKHGGKRDGTSAQPIAAHRAQHCEKIPEGTVEPLHRRGEAIRTHSDGRSGGRVHLRRQGFHAPGQAHPAAPAGQ